MKEFFAKKYVKVTLKILLTILTLFSTIYAGLIGFLILYMGDYWKILCPGVFAVIPILVLPLIWFENKKKWLAISLSIVFLYGCALGVNYGVMEYEESLIIDTSPNIRIEEYLPFVDDSKIVKLEEASLQLHEPLPIIDGAAAVFPVYSAFVYSVYPEDTKLDDKSFLYSISNYDKIEQHIAANTPFQYNNTRLGYEALAQKQTDIFFGAYPSKEQIANAKENGTEFEYTQIGTEAFVFFVHKNNPVNSLTTQQIKDIYAGKITNWKDVGGNNEAIVAFQRNEGSGSQSMLIRFMDGTPIMQPPIEQVDDLMSGIIEEVADYKNKSSSIGFSFRYYVEGIIQNPDIKMISIDGVYPNIENIKNGTYPVITPLYAVTYKNNPNPNVKTLLDWILTDEGQYIIEQTGYVGVN